jgi:hypothetical protein
MKFDKFVNKFITEAVKGQIAGYVEKQSKDINPATIIQDFITSKDPKFLLDAVTFANDKMNVAIKMGKNSFAGERFKAELKKELFELFTPTKQTPIAPKSNKFIVPLEEVKDLSTGEVKTSLMGSNAPNFFKRFYIQNPTKQLNPATRDVWFKLLNILYPEYERPSDIRQEGELGSGATKKVKVEYINDEGNKAITEITVRANDDTITGDPFSSRPNFENPKRHPINADRNWREFKSTVNANGGNLDAFVKAIKGKIVGERSI